MTERVWTVSDALEWMVGHFEREGVDAPRRSAEWLLSSATGLSRVEAYAFYDRPLSEEERAALRDGVRRRAAGEPLQYVTGEMPFRNIVVHVRPGVFIPRPETEVLVDVGLEAIEGVIDPVVVDLCTGSGCVACAIGLEVPAARVFATEISPVAVETARANVERLGLAGRVHVAQADLFEGVPPEMQGAIDLVMANPPYVPSGDLPDLPAEVRGFEPDVALDGGRDGLGMARRIMSEALKWLAPGGALAMELDERCAQRACEGARAWYQEVRVVHDLAGRERVLIGVGS